MKDTKWKEQYRKEYENLITKYNDRSWVFIPNSFINDYIDFTKVVDSYSLIPQTSTDYKTDNEIVMERIHNREMLDVFFDVEKEITNPYLFWTLVYNEYLRNDFHRDIQDKWEYTFTRYDRMELTLEERQNCVETVIFISLIIKLNDGDFDYLIPRQLSKKKKHKLLSETVKNFNKNMKKIINNTDEIIVYRGQSISKIDNLRVGRKKLNNPNAHIQDSGSGYSYTLNKEIAKYFAFSYSVKDDGLFFGNEDKSATNDVPSFIRTECINETSVKTISKCLVKKDNILFYTNSGEEEELVVLPQNVVLIDYKILDKRQNNTEFWKSMEKVA